MARHLAVGAAIGGRRLLVVPTAVFRVGDGMHRVLRGYKDDPVVAARRHFASSMQAHLSRFVAAHGHCLAAATGGWETVAVVPSSGRASRAAPGPGLPPHPFDGVVAGLPPFSSMPRHVLRHAGAEVRRLVPDRGAFAVQGDVRGRRVLLVDDTWVTGAHLYSAAAALGDAGAVVAGALVMGRSVDVTARPTAARWWSWVERGAVHPERCCLPTCWNVPRSSEAVRNPVAVAPQ
ncbi:MAG: hypothetical protein ABSG81_15440 [Acidimicrobiales bacterium]